MTNLASLKNGFQMFEPEKYRTIEINEKKIAYQRSGNGPVVLMIHGITTFSFIWRKMIEYLEDKYDLIRVDLLGCGYSEMSPDYDLSLKNHASIMNSFIETLELHELHLVGHDLGGGIVQIMAARYPERLLSISMLNPVGYDFWPVKPITTMRTPIFRQLAMAAFDRGYYRSIVKKALYKQESFTEELLSLFWYNFETSQAKKSFMRFAKCLNVSDLMEIEEDLKTLQMPVLLLRAERDVYLSTEITTRLHEDIPESQLIIIPESGHFMQEDAPEQISKALSTFWSRLL